MARAGDARSKERERGAERTPGSSLDVGGSDPLDLLLELPVEALYLQIDVRQRLLHGHQRRLLPVGLHPHHHAVLQRMRNAVAGKDYVFVAQQLTANDRKEEERKKENDEVGSEERRRPRDGARARGRKGRRKGDREERTTRRSVA